MVGGSSERLRTQTVGSHSQAIAKTGAVDLKVYAVFLVIPMMARDTPRRGKGILQGEIY
jgi:hypothetical protein